MVTLTGRTIDIDTKQPVIGAIISEWARPANNQISDANGNFTITLPDTDSTIEVDADGYNSFYGAGAMLDGDVQMYKSDAPISSAVMATVTNHAKALPGTLITAAAIILLFKIFKVI